MERGELSGFSFDKTDLLTMRLSYRRIFGCVTCICGFFNCFVLSVFPERNMFQAI